MTKQTPWSVKGIARIDHNISRSHLHSTTDAVNIQLNAVVDTDDMAAADRPRQRFMAAAGDDQAAAPAPSPYAFGPGRWRSAQVAINAPATPDPVPATDDARHQGSNRPFTSRFGGAGGPADSPQVILGKWQQMLQDFEKINLEQSRQRDALMLGMEQLQGQIDHLQNVVDAAERRVEQISNTVSNLPPPPSTLAIEQGVATTGRALMRLATRIEALEQQKALPSRLLAAIKGVLTAVVPRRSSNPGSARR